MEFKKIIAIIAACAFCFTSLPTQPASASEAVQMTETDTELDYERWAREETESMTDSTEAEAETETETVTTETEAEESITESMELTEYAETEDITTMEAYQDTPQVLDYYVAHDGVAAQDEVTDYKVVTTDNVNFLFSDAIFDSSGIEAFNPNVDVKYLQYKESDTFEDGTYKKAAYAIPNVSQNPRFDYVLFNGCRNVGETSYNASYSMGDPTIDYYVTHVAAYLTAMDLGIVTSIDFSKITDAVSNSTISGASDVWSMAYRLYNDAKEESNFDGLPIVRIEGPGSLDQWNKTAGGSWATDSFKMVCSNPDALFGRTNSVTLEDDTAIDGVSVEYDSESACSDFYVLATDSAYKKMQETGATLKITNTVSANPVIGNVYGAGNGVSVIAPVKDTNSRGDMHVYVEAIVEGVKQPDTETESESETEPVTETESESESETEPVTETESETETEEDYVQFRITKYNSNKTKTLPGAVYGVYADSACTVLVSQLGPTDASGTALGNKITQNILSSYYLQEITAPEGYSVDKTIYTVSANRNAVTSVEATDSVVGTVKVVLTDKDTSIAITDAEFTLYKTVNGVLNPIGIIPWNQAESAYVMTGLAPGTYKVTQTAAGAGYKLGDTSWSQTFEVSDDTPVSTFSVTNFISSIAVEITKVFGNTGVQGASYGLYSDPECTNLVASIGPTNSSGIASVTGLTGISEGIYYLKETTTPDGYSKDNTTYKVNLKNGTNKFRINSKSVSASLQIAAKAERTTGVELSNGRYQGERVPGSYTYGEQVNFSVWIRNTGNSDLNDVSIIASPSSELSSIIADSAWLTKSGVISANNNQLKVTAVDNSVVIETLKAGDSVELTFALAISKNKEVSSDTGLIVEFNATASYQTGSGTMEQVYKDDDDTDYDSFSVVAPKMSIAALADRTTGAELVDMRYSGTKVAGSYAPGETVNYKITVNTSGNVPISDVTVTSQMSDALRSVLTNTKFSGTDVSQSTDTSTVISNIEAGSSAELVFSGVIGNTDTPVLTNLENVFRVTANYSTGDSVKQVTTDSDDVDSDLINVVMPKVSIQKSADKTDVSDSGERTEGVYSIGETVHYAITVRNDGNVNLTNVTVNDELSEALASITSGGTGSFVSEEGFSSGNGNQLNVSVNGNTAVIEELAAGDYVTLQYDLVLDGNTESGDSELSNTATVTAEYNAGGSTVKLTSDEDDTATDTISVEYTCVEITKVSSADNTPLSGAVFEILSADGSSVVTTMTTGENGFVRSEPIAAGSYLLRESQAPQGYKLFDGTYSFSITDNGQPLKLRIKNTPLTGDPAVDGVKENINSGIVKTGDDTNIWIPITIVVAAVVVLIISLIVLKIKGKKTSEK